MGPHRDGSRFSDLRQRVDEALCEYKHGVQSRLAQPSENICWFFEMSLSKLKLRFSAGGVTPECCLATTLSVTYISIESLFLVLEHEMLLALQNPDAKIPCHPTIIGQSAAVPLQPDAAKLARLQVRSDIDQCYPMAAAVEEMMLPMLRSYRCRLPDAVWRGICARSLHVLQVAVQSLVKLDSETHALHAPCSDGGPLSWKSVNSALCIMLQHMICVIFGVMQEPSYKVRPAAPMGALRATVLIAMDGWMDVVLPRPSC
jgi:hypothetical protein